ncbi:MAG: DUF2283 domain-containing protein [Nitrospirae bacterium]|nr:DUF2283 domain-containing protein [Nitrospirota bacterium]MBF0533829.1 DUF2283 domain-containing protein [Nitrospirota bacterium]MBF0615462.1 DUF2283 domain-containing protein [Nitrospirota bacterium]
MDTKITQDSLVRNCLALVSGLLKFQCNHIQFDYDDEADVLYVSFRKPQRATETIETSEDILIRKDGDNVVGITVLNASTRRN